ncbi:MAG: DUF3795 domain-containing protein [Propionibacteriaceae bacterium]|nr:DUF3795 domain-containing protein [Propionibacteriaceae bacterium]
MFIFMENTFDSFCGLECAACEFNTSGVCGGCVATNGHPFHGRCEIAECVTTKNKRFCGECEDFPCEILKRYSYDAQHGDSGARVERCQAIKLAMVAAARVGINPVGFCGHHCDFCFMAQWCGGCRSVYNICSFATICPDGVCPNVACAQMHGLDGCYQCENLSACDKGYFGQTGEYVAKATALFIRDHGEAAYTTALQTAINSGMEYPKTFDATGSVEGALAILERWRAA